ncbi:MAG: hypothetical protein R2737_03410 [Candidatus Nanopelagicales bacterium]
MERGEDRWLLVLDDPVMGLAPWIAFGLLPYVTTFMTSTLIATALAGAIVGIAFLRGERPRALELSDVALFAALIVVGLVGTDGVDGWFEDHADLVSNAGLTLLALVSLLVSRPFTTPYTRARFPGLDRPLQRRLDVVATSAWGLGLGVATVVTVYGEYVLYDPDNLWTGWVFQAAPLVLAYNATLWFDRRAIALAQGHADEEPSAWGLVRNVAIWVAPVAVLALALHDLPVWLGWGLVVLGVAATWLAWQLGRRRQEVRRHPRLLRHPRAARVAGR